MQNPTEIQQDLDQIAYDLRNMSLCALALT